MINKKTFTIVWDPNNGISMPDGKVFAWVDKIVEAFANGSIDSVTVGQSLLVDALRVKIKLGEFDAQVQIKRVDGDVHSYIDSIGRYEDFCDVFKTSKDEDNVLDITLSRMIE